jgi:hypothetical protein
VGAWEAEGLPPEDSAICAADPTVFALALFIPGLGLEAILSDKHATRGLLEHLLNKPQQVHQWLREYTKYGKSKRKPGPRPNESGQHKVDIAAELRSQGLTYGQIMRKMNLGPNGRSLVSALLSQARKKGKLPAAKRQ